MVIYGIYEHAGMHFWQIHKETFLAQQNQKYYLEETQPNL